MRLLIIRHGDPDYEHNALTERGHREAAALSRYLMTLPIDDCYQSPYGRAQQTAEYYLRASGKTAETLDWLREFPARARYTEATDLQDALTVTKSTSAKGLSLVYNVQPSYWCRHGEYFDRRAWRNSRIAEVSDVVSCYDTVTEKLDELLKSYGYEHDGDLFRAVKPNHKVVALFCHFAVESVMLSHLLGLPPYVLMHGFGSLPSGVTELVTEERKQGIAIFRMLRYGDLSHLVRENIEPSRSGGFCECFTDEKRH